MQIPSVKKNFIYSTFYQVLNIITPFITAPYVARVLGADGIGIYSYTGSIETYFAMFAALGTASYGSREIARTRDDIGKCSRAFWEIELLSIVSTLISLILWIGLALSYESYRIYLLVLTVNLVAMMFDVSWFFNGVEQFKYIVLRNTVVKLVTIILIFVFIQSSEDLLLYIGISSAGSILGNISMWAKIPDFVETVSWRKLNIQHHFHETLIYFIPTVAISSYTVLDKTLIGFITADPLQNGWYEQATKIISMAKALVFASINSVMGARASYLFATGQVDEVHWRIERTMDYILFMGFGCCFGIIGIAQWFVPLFFGNGYEPVISLLYIMAPIVIIIGFSNCLGSIYYSPSGKRAESARYIIIGSVVNILCNLVLIPYWGAYGAAVGSIIAETLITILYLVNCGDYLPLIMIGRLSWKRAIAASLMTVVIISIGVGRDTSIVLLVSQIVFGGGAYAGVLLVMKDNFICTLVAGLRKHLRYRLHN